MFLPRYRGVRTSYFSEALSPRSRLTVADVIPGGPGLRHGGPFPAAEKRAWAPIGGRLDGNRARNFSEAGFPGFVRCILIFLVRAIRAGQTVQSSFRRLRGIPESERWPPQPMAIISPGPASSLCINLRITAGTDLLFWDEIAVSRGPLPGEKKFRG